MYQILSASAHVIMRTECRLEVHSIGSIPGYAYCMRPQSVFQVLVTAKERLRAASLRATKDGHLRLEAHRRESARDTRRLEDEAAHLREEISRLQG